MVDQTPNQTPTKNDLLDKAYLLVCLAEESCTLNHGPGVMPPAASDWLTVPIRNPSVCEILTLTIPICYECAQELANKNSEWILVYCLECNANHWLARPKARLSYGSHQLLWLTGCHNCRGFHGFYPGQQNGE